MTSALHNCLAAQRQSARLRSPRHACYRGSERQRRVVYAVSDAVVPAAASGDKRYYDIPANTIIAGGAPVRRLLIVFDHCVTVVTRILLLVPPACD